MQDKKKQRKDNDVLIQDEMLLRDEISGVYRDDGKSVIREEFLSYNMFVEAGAGAGKTYTIVQRVLNQLCIGKKPGEIVVITFTNKAAEELRGRIAKKLKERIDDKVYAEYAKNLKEAFNHLDDMNISTIHSFCFKLLGQRCFDAHLPVDLGLLDNNGTDEQKDRLFEEWVSGLTYDDWDTMQSHDPNEKSRTALKREIKSIYDAVCTMPKEKKVHIEKYINSDEEEDKLYREFEQLMVNMVNALEQDVSVSTLDDIYDFSDSLDEKKRFLGSRFTKNGRLCEKDKDGNVDYVRFWEALLAKEDSIGDKKKGEKKGYCTFKSTNIFKQGKYTKKDEKEKAKEFFDQCRDFIDCHLDEISRIVNGPIIEYRNIICRYAEQARAYYVKNRSISRLTNDALLELTRDMILGSDDAQAYFAQKYTCYYVDEFQDTDKVQEAFIWRLASKPENREELRDGALFIVGDPKQSIYRFRGAEPEVYMAVKSKMKAIQDSGGNARVYDLQINFRSNDLIIKWVNDKFSVCDGFEPIMVTEEGEPGYSYQDMIAKNVLDAGFKKAQSGSVYAIPLDENDKEHILAGVYRYRNPEGDKQTTGEADENLEELFQKREKSIDEEPSKADMQDLTDLILNLYQNEKYKIVDSGTVRKIGFRDFLVLCASKAQMNDYLEHMRLRGIPVQIAGDTDPREIMEINAFVRIYACLANRKDQAARVAALEAFRCLGLTDKEDELEVYGRAILDKLYQECRDMTAFGMALYLVNHLSVLLKKDRGFSAFEVQSVQTKLEQMIENVCSNHFGTPKEIAGNFYEYLDVNIEHELNLDENTDAVQFMNIHKSKGLEGNVVIVADRRGKDKGVSSFWVDNEYYPRAKQFVKLRERENEQLRAEKRRLEYVTATRAGQVLIFLDCVKGKPLFHGGDGAKYDLSSLPTMATIILEKDPHNEPKVVDKKYDLKKEQEKYETGRSGLTADMLVPGCQRISPSDFEAGVSMTKRRAIEEAKKNPNGIKREEECSKVLPRPLGNVFGTMMHRSLELLVNRYHVIANAASDARPQLIAGCARQAVLESRDEQDEVGCEKFLEVLLNAYFIKLQEWGWLDEPGVSYHTELLFSYYETAGSGEKNQLYYANKHLPDNGKLKEAPVWMNGSADLVLRKHTGLQNEEIVVVDYKSDNDYILTEEEFHKSMSEKYIGQLDNYRYAMTRLFGVSADRITMKVISFSQKDEKGCLYEDDTIRIRCTQIEG